MNHNLSCKRDIFDDLKSGRMKALVRKDDRPDPFIENDDLYLHCEKETLSLTITHVQRLHEVSTELIGYVSLSVEPK